jgi:hypothetical protein
LIGALLQKQPSRRLGHTAGGVDSVMRHPFFDGVDWQGMNERSAGQGPIVPQKDGEGGKEGGNFDEYPDEEPVSEATAYTEELERQYDREFEGF